MIAAFPFEEPRYQVTEFENGQACIEAIDQKPDIVLLDVEMPGLDGIETCRALRRADDWDGHVIFISVHNDLETRLRAYDAGGNDYIVKPAKPEELAQKVKVAEESLTQKRDLQERAQIATKTAFTAMSSMGELGGVLHFLRASYTCETIEQLAAQLIGVLQQFALNGLIAMRIPGTSLAVSNQGACTPLERSILEHAGNMGRVFQFRDRMVINYSAITLIASGLPLDDPEYVGRLRDHLAILSEGASARLAALAGEAVRMAQSRGIRDAFNELTEILGVVEKQQDTLRLNALASLDQYVQELEHAFVHLELNQPQEEALSNMARAAANRIGILLGDSKGISDKLQRVAARLKPMVT